MDAPTTPGLGTDDLADANTINFRWLVRLRWGAIAGQTLTIVIVELAMGIVLPLVPLFGILGLEAATNVACAFYARRARNVEEWMLGAPMLVDVLLLTGLLYLSGGAFNPFSFLYLVHVALAAVVLPARWTWALSGFALICFGALFLLPVHLSVDQSDPARHGEHLRLHLEGMWVAFGVAAAFIVYFVQRVRAALAEREAELAAARDVTLRNERVASLATMAAGAAHELSTPLSTIAVVAKELEHQLEGSTADADAISDARLIRQQVERCRDILQQMAADAGQGTGEAMIAVEVEALVETALSGIANRERIAVAIDGDARRRTLWTSPRAVSQALRSIVKNAAQAAGANGSVRLGVSMNGEGCEFTVRDDGAGMPPEVLRRAGEPFFTTKGPGRGMGLGLFLARTIVAKLGGTIEFESVPGRGTTVALRLPVGAQPDDAAASTNAA